MKKFISNIFGLRKDVGMRFYIADFFFRKILRQNPGTTWPVHHSSTIICPEKIERGKNVYPGDSPGNYIEGCNGIYIGDYTNLGPNVGIISSNHNLIDNTIHDISSPVRIGRFCWIGMNAVILPGVELGDYTIVGAGSVVSKSFTDGYCVIAGTPAVFIKALDKNACKKFSENK